MTVLVTEQGGVPASRVLRDACGPSQTPIGPVPAAVGGGRPLFSLLVALVGGVGLLALALVIRRRWSRADRR